MAPRPKENDFDGSLYNTDLYLNTTEIGEVPRLSDLGERDRDQKISVEEGQVPSTDGRNLDKTNKKNQGCKANFWQVGAVVGCFLANFFSGGVQSCYGVLYTYMQESLGVTEYQLSWIGSVAAGFHGFASIMATLLIDYKGCRVTTLLGPLLVAGGLITGSQTSNIYVLYITLGVLPGIGFCLAFNATTVYASCLFKKWRPLAVGISVAGSAAGMLSFSPVVSGIADIMGWRGAYLIQAALVLHLVPCALWMKPTEQTENHSDCSNEENASVPRRISNYLHVFKQSGTLFVCLAHFFMGLSYHTLPTFIPIYIMSSNPSMTTTDAALIVSLAGFGSFIGRVLFACASQAHVKAPQYILATAFCLCGLTHFTVPLNDDQLSFLVNGAFYGLTLGAWAVVAPVTYVNLFGLENLSKTIGAFTLCQGIGSFFGPPFLSYIAAITDCQELIFYTAGGFFVLSSVCVVPLLINRNAISRTRKTLVISVIGTNNDGFTGTETRFCNPCNVYVLVRGRPIHFTGSTDPLHESSSKKASLLLLTGSQIL